ASRCGNRINTRTKIRTMRRPPQAGPGRPQSANHRAVHYTCFAPANQNGQVGFIEDSQILEDSAGGGAEGKFLRQSNRLETDSSAAVRPIASPIRVAMDSTRMLRATRTASVGWIESVMTSSLSREAVRRATAPPDNTPWLI